MKIRYLLMGMFFILSCTHLPISKRVRHRSISETYDGAQRKQPDIRPYITKDDTDTRIIRGKRLPKLDLLFGDSIANIYSLGGNMLIIFLYGNKCENPKEQIDYMDSIFCLIPNDLVTMTIKLDLAQKDILRTIPTIPFELRRGDGSKVSPLDLFPTFSNTSVPLIAFVDRGLVVQYIEEGRFQNVINDITRNYIIPDLQRR